MPQCEGVSDTFLFYHQDPGRAPDTQALTLIFERGKRCKWFVKNISVFPKPHGKTTLLGLRLSVKVSLPKEFRFCFSIQVCFLVF